MSFKRKLFPNNQTERRRTTSHSGREIDLRSEFDEIVFGGATSLPHGKKILIRRARLDSDSLPEPCTCKDSLTREGAPTCPFCLGEGFYWDESIETCYSMYVGADGGLSSRVQQLFPGQIRVDTKIFYLRYDTAVSYRDKIVEIELDTEGDIVVPYTREAIHTPQTINKYRGDYGRIEYIAIHCRENDAIRLDK